MSDIGEPSIWHEKHGKNEFSQKFDFSWSQGLIFMILDGLGIDFHDFAALEAGLFFGDFSDFSVWFWGHPGSCDHPEDAKLVVGDNNSRITETDKGDPETETGSLESENRVIGNYG